MSDIRRLSGEMGIKNISAKRHSIVADFPLHWHEYYEIEYIRSGSGVYIVNNVEYAIEPGMLVFLTPVDFSSLHAAEKPIDILNISFSESWISDRIINDIAGYAVMKNYPSFNCDQIFKELQHEFEYSTTCVRFMLGCIIIDAIRSAKLTGAKKKDAKANNIVSEMLTYIHAHFREDPTLVALSDHIGLSPNYLSKLFHSHVGKTYKAYVVELKLKYASTLLSQTDTPVTDICYLCGFNSLAHFLRAFKEKFGVSPTVYRKENLLNK